MTKQALLVMDVQHSVVQYEQFQSQIDALFATLQRCLGAARSAGIPVIHVRAAFREGVPEISANNKNYRRFLESPSAPARILDSNPISQIHPAVAPLPGEVVVTKKRVSAFTGSDLAVVLRSLGVDTPVLTGIATSGVVLSTQREATDLDLAVTVLSDACLDFDAEVHQVLMTKIFPRHADVLTADQWISQLGAL